MKLAVSGFVAIAVHVLDDNFFQCRSQGLRRSTTALAAPYPPPARFRSRRAILLKPDGQEGGTAVTPLFDRSVKEDRDE